MGLSVAPKFLGIGYWVLGTGYWVLGIGTLGIALIPSRMVCFPNFTSNITEVAKYYPKQPNLMM